MNYIKLMDGVRQHGSTMTNKEIIELLYPPEIPKCCVCGTTEGLHKDGWYGYRCGHSDCCVF